MNYYRYYYLSQNFIIFNFTPGANHAVKNKISRAHPKNMLRYEKWKQRVKIISQSYKRYKFCLNRAIHALVTKKFLLNSLRGKWDQLVFNETNCPIPRPPLIFRISHRISTFSRMVAHS